jgi:Diaminopimelate decarboxylase
MDHFNHQQPPRFAEDVALLDIALNFGTPCFIYLQAGFDQGGHAYQDALENIRIWCAMA